MHLHRNKRYSSSPKAAALVLTVLLAAVAASIALALVSQTLSASRTEQLRNAGSDARQNAQNVLTEFELAIRSRPSLYLEKVLENEPDRICISNPSRPSYGAGTNWPASCGPIWEYDDSISEKTLKITPPTSSNPFIEVNSISKIGDTIYAINANYKIKGAGTFTIWTNSDLILENSNTGDETSVQDGVIYSTKSIALPSDDSNINLQNSQIIAEKGYVGTTTTNARLYSGLAGAPKSAREVVPSPLTLSQLRSDTLHLPSLACSANKNLFEYKNITASATLCFKNGEAAYKSNSEQINLPTNTESYLILPSPTAADEIEVYATTRKFDSAECLLDCDLPAIASTLPNTFLGNKTSWGTSLGSFKIPHSGLIFLDQNTFIGLCDTGYTSPNGVCQTVNGSLPGMSVLNNLTIMVGTPDSPKNILLASPIHSPVNKKLGVIATNSVIIPFFARPPQSTLNLELAAVALGYGIDTNTTPTFRTYPFDITKNSNTDPNFANSIEIKGSIYAPYFDLALNTSNSTSLLSDTTLLKTPPPHLPGFNIGVVRASTRNLTADEIATIID
jgi:hypothetical protein